MESQVPSAAAKRAMVAGVSEEPTMSRMPLTPSMRTSDGVDMEGETPRAGGTGGRIRTGEVAEWNGACAVGGAGVLC